VTVDVPAHQKVNPKEPSQKLQGSQSAARNPDCPASESLFDPTTENFLFHIINLHPFSRKNKCLEIYINFSPPPYIIPSKIE
jgi:hypothetical protein